MYWTNSTTTPICKTCLAQLNYFYMVQCDDIRGGGRGNKLYVASLEVEMNYFLQQF